MTSSTITPTLITDPAPGSPSTVSGSMGQGMLARASGTFSGVNIVACKALCEPVANGTAPGTKTCEDVKIEGKSFVRNSDGSWMVDNVPGARYKTGDDDVWNILHVCYYYPQYPYPPQEASRDTTHFRGVAASFVGANETPISRRLPQEVEGSFLANAGTASRFVDLVNTWWERDVDTLNRCYPSVRDGDWLLYRDLPGDVPFGVVLGLDGKTLRARSISVAAERVAIRRKLQPPIAHVATPQGEGRPAVNSIEATWPFPGFPRFGTVIHQPTSLLEDATTQPIHSSCRDCPTHMFTDPQRHVRVVVNFPESGGFLHEGHIDLWVRVNTH